MAKISESYVRTFMGASFKFGDIRTVKDFREDLEKIVEHLREVEQASDNDKVSEVYIVKGEFGYTLENGIIEPE